MTSFNTKNFWSIRKSKQISQDIQLDTLQHFLYICSPYLCGWGSRSARWGGTGPCPASSGCSPCERTPTGGPTKSTCARQKCTRRNRTRRNWIWRSVTDSVFYRQKKGSKRSMTIFFLLRRRNEYLDMMSLLFLFLLSADQFCNVYATKTSQSNKETVRFVDDFFCD